MSCIMASGTNHLLALPRYLWSALVYPLGALAVYAEHVQITSQVLAFFTNEDGTFGVFPQVQLGGETGTGGGVRIFHTNIAGKRKIFDGFYIYSGGQGQLGEALYLDPSVRGSRLYWKVQGSYLKTRNRSATINAAVREDLTRLFQLEQTDVETALGWRHRTGKLAPYLRNVTIEGRLGYGRRDFRGWIGGAGPLLHPGSTAEARLLTGLGQTYEFYRFGGRIAYDDRDYKRPTREISHPLNYKLPGRVVTYADGLYFYRDLGYPERGGLFAFEGEWVTGPDDFRFYRVVAEAQRYVTLFWRNRILAVRGRLEKVRGIDDGVIPYTDLVQLGGSEQMRGYRRGYFRGQGAVLFNVEYRYPIWDTWNAFIFWDEGQNFDHYDEIGRDKFRTSWGGGISLRTEIGLLGKVQVGHSAAEKVLIGFVLEQDF